MFQAMLAIVAAFKYKIRMKQEKGKFASDICILRRTLNREPIDENFDDLEDSSVKGGNNPETKGHLEALRTAWCSGTT